MHYNSVVCHFDSKSIGIKGSVRIILYGTAKIDSKFDVKDGYLAPPSNRIFRFYKFNQNIGSASLILEQILLSDI